MRKQPKYLNLFKIKLPLPGVVSILHRMSGALLFVALPFFLSVLQLTLASPETFEHARQGLASPLVKLMLIGLLWGFFHHFCAGLRYLAMDLDFGVGLQQTRRNSWLVMAVSLSLTALTGAWLW